MNTIELITWEKATQQHHPREYEYVLLYCEEDQYPYPQVIEGYWTDASEGYFSLLEVVPKPVKAIYWAKLPGGPRERNKGEEDK